MSYANPEALVSTEWLAEHLADPDVRILDCTWHHTSTNLDGRTQYRGRHLPGSVHFDIDHIADKSNPLPHMLPSAADFAKKVGLLGIGDGDRVVVYDRLCGGAAAARVWWMFRVFGYDKVAMLDGGYGKWTKEKLPTDMSMVRPEQKSFSATYNPALVRSLRDMTDNLVTGAAQVIDARGPGQIRRHPGRRVSVQEARPHPERHQHSLGRSDSPRHRRIHRGGRARRAICRRRDRSAASDRDELRLRHHLLRGGARALSARTQDTPPSMTARGRNGDWPRIRRRSPHENSIRWRDASMSENQASVSLIAEGKDYELLASEDKASLHPAFEGRFLHRAFAGRGCGALSDRL